MCPYMPSLAMADGDGEGIGGVVRFGHCGKAEDEPHESLHIFLAGPAGTGGGFLHVIGAVFVHGEAAVTARKPDDAAGFRHNRGFERV